MKKKWFALLLALVTALFVMVVLATPTGVQSAVLATDTRWPTSTRRPTDTRWAVKPTSTRWPTSTRRGASSATPTLTPTITFTPTPSFTGAVVRASSTPTGLRPTNTRWAVKPTSTRWPSLTPRPTDTRWPTSTRWPTKTLSPTITVPPTNTVPPTETFTPTLSPTPTFTFTVTETATEGPSPTATSTPLPFFEGPIVIGYSVQNRPLEVYRFGTGPIERMIVAGMHGGNEYNTVKLADQLIEYIKAHPEVIPEDVTLYILRCLNPDGVARGLNIYGRTNANNVDLNRNWDANWQADWPRTGCWSALPTTGGTGPGSEPETQAVMAFIQAHHVDALINYHSAYLGIFAGGVPDYPPSFALADAVDEVTTYPWPPINTGCVYTGGMVDWTAAQGIASLDVELSTATSTDFTMNLRVLEVLVKWRR